jgi:hypothetical protein
MTCPKCKTDAAHRSHRKGIVEYLVSVFSYRPYRCHSCECRFLYSPYFAEDSGKNAAGETSREQEIRTTRNSVRRKQFLREVLVLGLALLLFLLFLRFITRESKPPSDN